MDQHTTSKMRVYLVEDQALVRESMHTLFELVPEVALVGAVISAEQALMQLEVITVDVVLMDVGLPGIDGIEATRLLKQRHPEVAVVMLTAHEDEFMGAAMEAGAEGYIPKSCTSAELVRTMRDALDLKHRRILR